MYFRRLVLKSEPTQKRPKRKRGRIEERRTELTQKIARLTDLADRIQAYLTRQRRRIYQGAEIPRSEIKETIDFEKMEAHLRMKIEFYQHKLDKLPKTKD